MMSDFRGGWAGGGQKLSKIVGHHLWIQKFCEITTLDLSYVKVNKNRNDFMKTSFGPKSNVILVRISALLYSRSEILTQITLLYVFIKSFRFLLTFN